MRFGSIRQIFEVLFGKIVDNGFPNFGIAECGRIVSRNIVVRGKLRIFFLFRGKEWCLKTRADDIALGDGDRITVWRKCQSKRSMTVPKERREGFPDEIRVRVITAAIRARGFRDEKIVVVTSLLDPEKYPKEMILKLYLRRWERGGQSLMVE